MFDLEPYFDIALSIPDGIKKLREMILTLAMQGKLVPQDPNDQPASELLKEIEAEKKRQLKQGKFKKSKPLAPVAKEEIPYEIPDSWKWVKLGDIGNIFNGNSINANEKQRLYTNCDGYPYIATKDVGYGYVPLNYSNGVRIPFINNKFKIAHAGAVLLCSEGGSAGKKCGIAEQDICFGNKLFANELFSSIPSKFLLYIYLSDFFQQNFLNSMTGIIGGVSIAKFVELTIPLPPLAEQKRIVAKVEQQLARCDALEQLKADRDKTLQEMQSAAMKRLLDASSSREAWQFLYANFNALCSTKENIAELRKAILQLAVMGKLVPQNENDDDIHSLRQQIKQAQFAASYIPKATKSSATTNLNFDIPVSWDWVPLSSLLIYGPTNGFSPRATNYETKTRSLMLTATTSGHFKGEYSKFILDEIPEESELWLKDGDVLVQRGNTIEYVGVPCIYRGEDHAFIYPDLMMKLRLAPYLDEQYIYYAMSSEPCRNYLKSKATGTSGTMPKISQGSLCNLPIPLPPRAEQKRIVAKIESLLSYCDKLELILEDHQAVSNAVIDEMVKRATFVSKFTKELFGSGQMILDKAFDTLVKTQGKYVVSLIENDLRTVWDVGYQELKPIFIDMAKRDDKYKYIAVRYMETSNSSVGVVSEFQRPLAQHYGIKKFSNLSLEEDRRRFWELFRKKYCD